MKLGLVQTVHNEMYQFLREDFPYSPAQCRQMQAQMQAQSLALLGEAVGQGCDLLVIPECTNYIRLSACNCPETAQEYPLLDAPEIKAYGECARAAQSWLVAGLGYRAQNGNAYNAALVFDRTGALRHVYHKTHLVGDEPRVFTRGTELLTVQADFGCFGVCICWDLQFPELTRALMLRGADLIVCPTWGWEKNLYGRARAYENGIFVAAAMAVPSEGIIKGERSPSSAVAPDGTEVAVAQADAAQLLLCELDLTQTESYKKVRLQDRQPHLYGALLHEGHHGPHSASVWP